MGVICEVGYVVVFYSCGFFCFIMIFFFCVVGFVFLLCLEDLLRKFMEVFVYLGYWGIFEMGVFICLGWVVCGEEEIEVMGMFCFL